MGTGALFLTAAVVLASCAGGSSGPPTPKLATALVVAGVNDHPRNPGSANFEARRAAAHAKGLWLTDELNAPPPGGIQRTVRHPGGTATKDCLTYSSVGRRVQTVTCDGGANFAYASLGYNPPAWDTQIDFSDGTSLVSFEDGTDANGDPTIVTLDPDGSYTYAYFNAYDQIIGVSAQTATPTPAPPSLCQDLQAAGDSCTIPPPQWCPLIAGYGGLAAKYAALATLKNKPASDAIGVTVAFAVGNYCYSVQGASKQKAMNLAFATR